MNASRLSHGPEAERVSAIDVGKCWCFGRARGQEAHEIARQPHVETQTELAARAGGSAMKPLPKMSRADAALAEGGCSCWG
jgi:hypothetical protein